MESNLETSKNLKVKYKKKHHAKSLLKLKMPKGYDHVIHACVIILLIFGSIMVVSTSVGESANDSLIVYKTIMKQVLFVVASYFFMSKVALNFFQPRRRDKASRERFKKGMLWLGIAIILMLAACQLFPGANGSKAWIYIPGVNVSIQPSEFAKCYIIVLFGLIVNYYAELTAIRRAHNRSTKIKTTVYMKFPLIFSAAFSLLILLQPDLGSFIVFAVICMSILLIPTNPCLRSFQTLDKVLLVIILILLLIITTPIGVSIMKHFIDGYQLDRITDAADPFKNIYQSGYNLVYSLYAIANGGFTGLGIGASEQKFGYLPEAQTDFILSITVEELGILGLLLIVACYGLILYRLFYWATKAMTQGQKVILIGCCVYMASHFILNVGGVSGLIPLTGVPLLFMSSGGSSLLSIMILLGVCQAVIAQIRNQRRSMDEGGLLRNRALRNGFEQ